MVASSLRVTRTAARCDGPHALVRSTTSRSSTSASCRTAANSCAPVAASAPGGGAPLQTRTRRRRFMQSIRFSAPLRAVRVAAHQCHVQQWLGHYGRAFGRWAMGRVQVLLDKMLKHFKANGHKVRFLAAARGAGDEALGSRDPKCARWRSEV